MNSYSLILSEGGRWRSHGDGHIGALGEGEDRGNAKFLTYDTAVEQLTQAGRHSMAVASDVIAQTRHVEPLSSICHARHLLP